MTFVSVGAHGERSFLFFRHPSADQMIAEHDVDEARSSRARASCTSAARRWRASRRARRRCKALAAAKRAGCLVSTDPNWRAHLWENPAEAAPMLQSLVAQCDIVKISDDELAPLCGVHRSGGGRAQAARARARARRRHARSARLLRRARGRARLAAGRARRRSSTRPAPGTASWRGCWRRWRRSSATADGPPTSELDESGAACRIGNKIGAAVVTRLGATDGVARTRTNSWYEASPRPILSCRCPHPHCPR